MRVLGMELEPSGLRVTFAGVRMLYETATLTPEAQAEWDAVKGVPGSGSHLSRFSRSTRWGRGICLWHDPEQPEPTQQDIDAAWAAAREGIERYAEESARRDEEWAARRAEWDREREEWQREREERAARKAAAEANRDSARETAIEDLRELSIRKPWAIHFSYADDVARLLGIAAPAWGDREAARVIVAKTQGNIDRARARVDGYAPGHDDLKLAQDAESRAVIADGVVYVTSLDGDRASVENGAGWGKTASASGHTLAAIIAETGGLTDHQAAYALALLRRHRGQLPALIQGHLFDKVAPARSDAERTAREDADAWYAARISVVEIPAGNDSQPVPTPVSTAPATSAPL